MYPGAYLGIGRKVMSDLKATLHDMIKQHIRYDLAGRHHINGTTGEITFSNGSKIALFSWANGDVTQFRSYAFSSFIFEELTENDKKDVYDAVLMRCGRLKHVEEKFLLSLTNPDDPAHWAYKKLVINKNPNIHVYYSLTKDNKFLPSGYVEMLEENLDPKMARRMLHGEWLSIGEDVIYYAYKHERNYHDYEWAIDNRSPIMLAFDFNIGQGKPMSSAVGQYIDREYHWFDEAVIEGARTESILEEWANRGLFERPVEFRIYGDATGNSRNTASKYSNYDIIRQFLANYTTKDGRQLDYKICVPKANPAIRTRHNIVNAYMQNALGEVRFHVYKKAQTLDEGCRLTKLKDKGQYLEDDSKPFQHITTAIGYAMVWEHLGGSGKKQGTVIL